MRPQKLSITGFRSYNGPTPTIIDFTGVSTAAVIGATGAGKSSILEAVTYALYGRCSWSDEVRPLLADGATAMRVELEFTHDAQRWTITRSMRKGKTQNTSTHRLENQDTGARYDNASLVNAQVRTLLQMDYATFESVVLLPQDRFDRLLSARGGERATILHQLFGADELLTARDLADRRARAISTLLADARERRAALHPDPAARAAEADAAAASALLTADRLAAALREMTGLRAAIHTAANRRTQADTAAAGLEQAAVTDADAVLKAIAPIAAEIQQRSNDAERRLVDARRREEDLGRSIRDANDEGRSVGDVRSAQAVITGLPAAAADLEGQALHIEEEQIRLQACAAAIEADTLALAARGADSAAAGDTSGSAAAAAQTVQTKLSDLRDCVTLALQTADVAARAAESLRQANEYATYRHENLPGLQRESEQSHSAVADAATLIEKLTSQNAAAAIAATLVAGEDCPVCHHRLPAGFRPPRSADVKAIKKALAAKEESDVRQRTADRNLAEATAEAESAARTAADWAAHHGTAVESAHTARDAVATSYADLAANLPADPVSNLLPAPQFEAAVRAALDTVSAGGEGRSDGLAEAEAALTTEAQAAARTIAHHAEELTAQAISAALALHAATVELDARRAAHDRDQRDLVKAVARYDKSSKAFTGRVGALPAVGRMLLPEDPMSVTDATVAGALGELDRLLEQLQALDRLRDAARAQAAAAVSDREAAAADAEIRVDQPLRGLLRRLEGWAEAARRADHSDRTLPEQTASAPTIGKVELYAVAVGAAATDVSAALGRQSADARADEARLRRQLAEAGRSLAGHVEGLDAGADLAAADGLNPVVAAEATARREAGQQAEIRDESLAQVQQASDLDYAIRAGSARHAAVDEVRKQLANAKFLAYLTSRRTEALLGIASEILGELSDGGFGFAPDFKIVSRSSRVVHGHERMSGGERFLASLALALALVELHARGGPRLGALFLDEGFAALDAATLDTALSVLHNQAEADRLVVTVSHLHAVAETVDDVLWVEKGATGSKARWLTAAERDALQQMDLQVGLQRLA